MAEPSVHKGTLNSAADFLNLDTYWAHAVRQVGDGVRMSKAELENKSSPAAQQFFAICYHREQKRAQFQFPSISPSMHYTRQSKLPRGLNAEFGPR